MVRKIRSPCATEDQEQAHVIAWCDTIATHIWPALTVGNHFLILAIPNGGARSAVTGARMRRTGTRAGVPDLFLPVARKCCAGLWLEIKRRDGGRVSDAQRRWLAALEMHGYRARVCAGSDEAISEIMEYLR